LTRQCSRRSQAGTLDTPLRILGARAAWASPGRLRLSTVGNLGQIVTVVVAHGGQVGSGRGTGRRATQASPPFFPATPAPTRRTRFPARFTKFLPLREGDTRGSSKGDNQRNALPGERDPSLRSG